MARTKTGGREKGTPNYEVTVERVVPPRCPRCKGTDLAYLRPGGTQRHHGIAPDGQPYNLIIRRRVQCRRCNQVIAQTIYEMVDDGGG